MMFLLSLEPLSIDEHHTVDQTEAGVRRRYIETEAGVRRRHIGSNEI
jgi:hypothetical protein